MSAEWLDGAEHIPSAHAFGNAYTGGPWRIVLHTTEVIPSSIAGARAMAASHQSPPHLWAWPGQGWLGQTVSLDRASYALEHPAGTPDTNNMHAIQVEMIGYAEQTPTWPGDWWAWIGEHVVAPIVRAGYPIDLYRLGPTCGNQRDAVRQSRDWWAGFDGICGHANVPDQTLQHHWDPGRADYGAVADAARRFLDPPKPDPAKEYLNVNAVVHPVVMTLGPDGRGWSLTDAPVVHPYIPKEDGHYYPIGDPGTYSEDVLTWYANEDIEGRVKITVTRGTPGALVSFEVIELVPT